MDGIISMILSVQSALLSLKLEDISAISRRSRTTLTHPNTVQLLRSGVLGHEGSSQIRINMAHLENVPSSEPKEASVWRETFYLFVRVRDRGF